MSAGAPNGVPGQGGALQQQLPPPAFPFEITLDAPSGQLVATDGRRVVTLLEPDSGRMFRRRAVKRVGRPDAFPVEWLVTELSRRVVDDFGDLVAMPTWRVYVDSATGTVVLSQHDLQP